MANDYTARTVPIPQPGEAAAAYEKRLAGFLRQEFQNVERAIDRAATLPVAVATTAVAAETAHMTGTYYDLMMSSAERVDATNSASVTGYMSGSAASMGELAACPSR